MYGVAQLINEAWGYESNNDQEVALRLYKTAFNNILDVNGQIGTVNIGNMLGVSPFEIRSVADYINNRTCYIHFVLNHPREAITQFKRFIDTFKQHTKAPEYAFEHAAWLSQQYLMFAELFHQAASNGLKASRAQHPGLYYFEAALQLIERRKNVTEHTNDSIRSNQMPVTNELLAMITTSNFSSFLRQCGWTCIDPEAGPPIAPVNQQMKSSPNPPSDQEPINYSEIIIRALFKAMEYFEEWNRPRMQNCISVMIADEYLANKELQKARALYSRSSAMYEKELWTQLSDDIVRKVKFIGTEEGLIQS